MDSGKKGEGSMSNVVSATTRFARRVEGAQRLLEGAHIHLAQADRLFFQGDMCSALEYAYRAALRAAGARVAMSSIAARKRKPTSAIEQLRLVGASESLWADRIAGYSRLRSRVSTGVEVKVAAQSVQDLMTIVSNFLHDIEGAQDGSIAA